MDITVLRPKSSNIAIAYSTKDRKDFTMQTFAPLIAQNNFDLFWIDGSDSKEGKDLPFQIKEFVKRAERWKVICEIHSGIGGGAAMAILYALNLLYQKGYEYIGLCENDVLLAEGWLEKCRELLAKKPFYKNREWKVGAVSARTYTPRILEKRGDYAIMANLGAGMIIFEREMVPEILKNFTCPPVPLLQNIFKQHGIDYPIPWCCGQANPSSVVLVHDWFWEAVLLCHGRLALAPNPTLARNIDGWAEPHLECDQPPSQSTLVQSPPDMQTRQLPDLGRSG